MVVKVPGAAHLHLVKHVLRVKVKVARGLPQVQLGDVGADDQAVAGGQVLLLPVALDQVAHDAALGVPQHQARPRGLPQAEQVQLLPQLPVVPASGFRV